MPTQKDFIPVNLSHPLQDVHRVRQERKEHYRYKVARNLLPEFTAGMRVLEVGCGRSEFARQLSDLGFEVVVTDLSPSNIEFAKSVGFEAYQVDLNLGLGEFKDQSFDAVVILDVIEHVIQVEFLLEEIFRVLKQNGFLILSTPNFVFFENRLRILFGGLSIDEGYHFRFFTVKSLTKQLKNAGFAIEAWKFLMPVFIPNRILRLVGIQKRLRVSIPKRLASVFAQTMAVRVRKPSTEAK